jgi:uncharacterized coiled-coil protein SlyX
LPRLLAGSFYDELLLEQCLEYVTLPVYCRIRRVSGLRLIMKCVCLYRYIRQNNPGSEEEHLVAQAHQRLLRFHQFVSNDLARQGLNGNNTAALYSQFNEQDMDQIVTDLQARSAVNEVDVRGLQHRVAEQKEENDRRHSYLQYQMGNLEHQVRDLLCLGIGSEAS